MMESSWLPKTNRTFWPKMSSRPRRLPSTLDASTVEWDLISGLHFHSLLILLFDYTLFRILVRRARKIAVEYELAYGEEIPVIQLVTKIAIVMQEYTQSGYVLLFYLSVILLMLTFSGVRPFGVSLLIAGWDKHQNRPLLFQSDPSVSYFLIVGAYLFDLHFRELILHGRLPHWARTIKAPKHSWRSVSLTPLSLTTAFTLHC